MVQPRARHGIHGLGRGALFAANRRRASGGGDRVQVDDLDAVLARAKAEGVEPVKLFPDEANGKFAHIMDLEGRKIELWQPKPMS